MEITNVIKTTMAQLRNMLPKIKFLSKVILKFRAEAVGVKFWSRIAVGKKHSILSHCFCVPMMRNYVLSIFSFNLLSFIEWKTIPELVKGMISVRCSQINVDLCVICIKVVVQTDFG